MTTPRGPIALLGSGEFEPWTSDLDRMLLEHASSGTGAVAIVPTASALEGRRFDDWARQGLEHYARLGVPARVVDLRGRDDADRLDLIEQLEETSLIFFSGGNPAFLARTLAGTAFWDAVVERVAEGAAFAGCSAGACIAGAFAPESMTDAVWEERWLPGLELVPDVWVLPHFDALDRYRSDLRSYFLSRVPDAGWALGVDERTAAVRVGGAWSVHGEGGAFL
ncbi:MAG TPA: Type 1 glutamine amidotransferase-like domain-containing protein, partial [Actinomycetota bacterium]|nr:Type 1 glutamine amidotransferase-like domain-containing protein [Actinomycetota bacterium]